MKNIVLLGSTGSVGRNVLEVVRAYPDRFRVTAISSNENVALLSEQAEEFKVGHAAIGNERFYKVRREEVPGGAQVLAGSESLEELACFDDADLVFLAISGTAALRPLLSAVRSGKTVALASKEPIVSAGEYVISLAKEHSARILPVDSEHSAVLECLSGTDGSSLENIYITGSGGSLLDKRVEVFDELSVDEVLSHPKWDMGRKITVDSATLMNKGLEVIEARWLFDVHPDRIRVIIHPEAIIHSMVELSDGTVRASLFCPDMRFPILRALSFPDVLKSDLPRIDFPLLGKLTFQDPDLERFPALDLAYRAVREGGTLPAVLNGANEAAVRLFLEGAISFTGITKKVERVMSTHSKEEHPSLQGIMDAERWAYEEVFRSC